MRDIKDIENLHGFAGVSLGWFLGGAIASVAMWGWLARESFLGICLWGGVGTVFLCGWLYYLGKTKGGDVK